MKSIMNIALSGMQAAVLRASVSADNIANAQSAYSIVGGNAVNQPYLPQDVIQISDPNGGAHAYVQPSCAEPLTSYDPTDGSTLQLPNVDLAEELVKTQQASTDYMANLKVAGYASNMLSSLVDIFA